MTYEKGKYGQIRNITLEGGMDGVDYMRIFEQKARPFLEERAPELLLFSAGFDADARDPLASINLEAEDFYNLTRAALEATRESTKGRSISVLEGGYDLDALEEGTRAHLEAIKDFYG